MNSCVWTKEWDAIGRSEPRTRDAKMNTNGRRKVKFLSRKEGRKLLDKQARRYLQMTGKEFVRKWNAKEFDDPDRPEVMHVAFLIPFGG